MPPIPVYPPYPVFAVCGGIACGAFVWLVYRRQQRHEPRGRWLASLAVAAILGAATFGLAVASYVEYVQMNTYSYFYELDVQPSGTSTQIAILPIPTDPSLVANLHLASGAANWSFVDTVHGRGLYVQFSAAFELDAPVSEFSPGGPTHSRALSMVNDTIGPGPLEVWIFASDSGAAFHFQPEGMVAQGVGYGDHVLVAGWHVYPLIPPP